MSNQLWNELKKRNVHKAFLSYAAVTWFILQAASILFPILGLPSHFQRSLLLILLVGLPFWLVFAWYYEYTTKGFVRADEIPDDDVSQRKNERRLNLTIIGVLSAAVVLLLTDRIFHLSRDVTFDPVKRAIAVLPFANLSLDEQQTYYALGMQDELISQLASLSDLRVISRTSTLKYMDGQTDMPTIAKELGVDLIVEGSLLKYEDSVRIQIQLIDMSSSEDHLWNRDYDRPVKNVLDMHSEVTTDIARSINLAISPSEQSNLSSIKEVDPRAYDALLRGRFHIFKFTPQDIQLGMQYFQQALEIDPEYAEAYSAISGTGGFLLVIGALPPSVAGEIMMNNALRSIELDPNSASGYSALASAQTWSSWEWAKAEESWNKAIELDPNDATTQIYYSHFLACMGRHEQSIEHGLEALRLDPFNAFFHGLYGVTLMTAGKYDEAYDQCQKALAMDPSNPFPFYPITGISNRRGDSLEAYNSLKRYNQLLGDTVMVNAMDAGFQSQGTSRGFIMAAEALQERRKFTYIRPHLIALSYDLAGETVKALDWLDTCMVYRDHDMTYAGVAPYTENLRKHPRFKEIVDKMSFPFDYLRR